MCWTKSDGDVVKFVGGKCPVKFAVCELERVAPNATIITLRIMNHPTNRGLESKGRTFPWLLSFLKSPVDSEFGMLAADILKFQFELAR